jgi:histidine triad (HIT) family protein
MSDCIFCRIVSGEIPADKVLETETVLAFRDIDPQSPTHVLLVPKHHLANLNDLATADPALIAELYSAAVAVAHREGVADSGYRTVINCNADGGQLVPHLHLHLLGGRRMQWPPG